MRCRGCGGGLAGQMVKLALDWERRHRLMREHTALHLLLGRAALPRDRWRGECRDGRLDFDIPESGLDREAIEAELNRLIATDAAVTDRLITEAELDANPGLVKTCPCSLRAAPARCGSWRSRNRATNRSISALRRHASCGKPASHGRMGRHRQSRRRAR